MREFEDLSFLSWQPKIYFFSWIPHYIHYCHVEKTYTKDGVVIFREGAYWKSNFFCKFWALINVICTDIASQSFFLFFFFFFSRLSVPGNFLLFFQFILMYCYKCYYFPKCHFTMKFYFIFKFKFKLLSTLLFIYKSLV